MKRSLIAGVFFVSLVGLWQAAVMSGRWSPGLLPSPYSVAQHLQSAVTDGSLIEACRVTLFRLLTGYAIGILLGLPVGLFMSVSRFAEDTLGSLALGLQTLPSVC